MASEIRVNKINSQTGVGTITLSPTGVDIAGITTAVTLRATTGIVTSLTAGSLTSLGAVSGTTGTFTGAITGTTGTFTGDVTFDGETAGRDIVFDRSNNALEFADNAVASFGASGDLRIFHNGSDSVLQDQGTGSLLALTNTFHIKNAANNETLAKFIEDGAVELYHNNNEKFSTTSQGAAIGQVSTIPTMDSFSCQIQAGNSGFIGNYHSGSNQQFIIGLNQYYQGGYKAPDNNVSQHLQLYNKKFNFLTAPAPGSDNGAVTNTNILTIDGDGVKFGTDTAAANALDDYEEGTWTPTVTDGGSAFGTNNASYVKIGKMVTVSFDLLNNSGGNIYQVFGLPFPVAQYAAFNLAWISNSSQGAQGASDIQGGLITTSSNHLGFRVAGGNNSINVADGVRFIGSGTYETS